MIVLDENLAEWTRACIKRGGATSSTGNPEEYLLVRLNNYTAVAFDRIKGEIWNIHVTQKGQIIFNFDRTFEKDSDEFYQGI